MNSLLKTSASVGALALFLAASPVSATDLKDTKGPVLDTNKAVNWSGIWLGGHIGYGNANHEVDVSEDGFSFLNLDGLNSHGAVYGVDGGVDIARNGWVFGVLGGYDWSGMETELSVFDGAFGCSLENKGQWHAGGRVGRIVSSNVMLYGLIAYTQAKYELGCDGLDEKPSETYRGIRAGAGFEYALDGGLSLKGQYAHDFFEDKDWIKQDGFRVTDSLDQDIVTIGVSYKLGLGLPGLN